MRKSLGLFISILLLLVSGCSAESERVTGKELLGYQKEYDTIEKNQTYYYRVEGRDYQYKVKVSGRSNNAKYDSYYIVLTNTENITFDEIDKQFWSSTVDTDRDFYIVEYGLIEL